MKKVDIFCFLLALFLSCLFLYFFSYDPSVFQAEELKIGLVAIENNDSIGDDKATQNQKKQEEKNTVEEKQETTTEQVEEKTTTEETKPSLADLKKTIEKPKLDSKKLHMDTFHRGKEESSIDVDSILAKTGEKEGLPSGSRMGVIDGNAIIHWNPENQEPIFPEIAKKTGKNGAVILVIMVNEAGEVISVKMERGSGVPEINVAIEKIARTWNIKLVRKGKSVGGSFVLKYSFHLE